MKETRHLRCVNGEKYKTSENVPYGGQTREEFTPLHDGNSDDKKTSCSRKNVRREKCWNILEILSNTTRQTIE
jgi:hypothetical protein